MIREILRKSGTVSPPPPPPLLILILLLILFLITIISIINSYWSGAVLRVVNPQNNLNGVDTIATLL